MGEGQLLEVHRSRLRVARWTLDSFWSQAR
jgi:hypothetical protein